MVEQVVVALVLHCAAVNGKAVVGQPHYLALIRPRAGYLVGRRVGPVFGHAAGGILQVVLAITLVNPRGLLEVGLRRAVVVVALEGAEGLLVLGLHLPLAARNGGHRLRQLRIPQVVIAIEEVRLTVVVDHHRGVDLEPSLHQRFADRVAVGSGGVVGHGHTDTGIGLALDGGRHIPVPLAITLYALAGPAVVVLLGPGREGGRRQRRAAIGPVYHVDSAVEQPVLHGEVAVQGLVLVMVDEEVERVAVNIRCRVGRIAVADGRVLGTQTARRQTGGDEQG